MNYVADYDAARARYETHFTTENLQLMQQAEAAIPWWVNEHGSHPDEGNDDHWTGCAFDDEAGARAYLQELLGGSVTREAATAFVELKGPDVRELFPVERTSVPDKESDAEWQREMAMEAGMGLGIDAYNDAMGWGPEDDR